MNILVVAHHQGDRTPTTIFIHAQILAYRDLGHHIRVLVPIAVGKRDLDGERFSGPLLRREVDGVEHIFLRHLSLSNFGKKHMNTPMALRALQKNLHVILDGFTPDIVHAHTLGLDSSLGAWLKEHLKLPLVVTTHGSDTLVPFNRGQLSMLKRFAGQADHLVCVSTMLMRCLQDCKIKTPISVILNGFQLQAVVSNPNKPPVSLIQAGYLISRKKADITIQAFAALRQNHSKATLDIIGSGSELSRFQALCKELGVEDSVHFHGYLPNQKTLAKMAESRFFVMPSVNEGFGIVYLEAMASGCVTIGTEKEGIADLIVSGKNGFLVPPDDPNAIVRTIEWCLAHPEESASIAEKGRQDAQALTWEKNAIQYTQLFNSLTERNSDR